MKNIHIFDLDGTLIVSMPYVIGSVLQVLEENHIPYGPEIIETVTPMGYPNTARLFQTMGVPGTVDEIVARFMDILYHEYAHNIPLKPGAADYLRRLKQAGAQLHILTGSPHLLANVCLQRNGIRDLFDSVWSVDDFDMSKAEVAIYHEMVRRLGCAKEDICFYDDTLTACTTAVEAGWHTCAVNDGQKADVTAALQTVAHQYIASFEDLISG